MLGYRPEASPIRALTGPQAPPRVHSSDSHTHSLALAARPRARPAPPPSARAAPSQGELGPAERGSTARQAGALPAEEIWQRVARIGTPRAQLGAEGELDRGRRIRRCAQKERAPGAVLLLASLAAAGTEPDRRRLAEPCFRCSAERDDLARRRGRAARRTRLQAHARGRSRTRRSSRRRARWPSDGDRAPELRLDAAQSLLTARRRRRAREARELMHALPRLVRPRAARPGRAGPGARAARSSPGELAHELERLAALPGERGRRSPRPTSSARRCASSSSASSSAAASYYERAEADGDRRHDLGIEEFEQRDRGLIERWHLEGDKRQARGPDRRGARRHAAQPRRALEPT